MTDNLIRTARVTGALYLALAVFGGLGFIVVRSQIIIDGDAAATAANLVDREALARFGVAAEMAAVVTQTLAGLWFFRLFRKTDSFAAGSLAVFAAFNAVIVLVGAAFTATAIGAATGDFTAPGGDQAATMQLMLELKDACWGVGQLFFGLWLIPMGRLVVTSGYMPRLLGYILMVGGVTYMAAAFTMYLWPTAPTAVPPILTALPTIGEFWIIGYLLIIGVRRSALDRSALPA